MTEIASTTAFRCSPKQSAQLAHGFSRPSPLEYRRLRVEPVFRHGLTDAFDPLGRPRTGAQSSVKTTTSPVPHRRTPARSILPRLRPTPRRREEIAGRIPVFQPPAPLQMGCLLHFRSTPPPPASPPLVSEPATRACPPSDTWTCCTTTVCLPPVLNFSRASMCSR